MLESVWVYWVSSKIGLLCLKLFPSESFGDKLDYSGFNRTLWPVRIADEHRRSLTKIAKAKSPSQQLELEAKCGARYSELCRLPYLNIIRHHQAPCH